MLLTENKQTNDTLQITASGRHKRVYEMIRYKTPKSIEDHFDILSDINVKMTITVQQMIFNPLNGDIHLKT